MKKLLVYTVAGAALIIAAGIYILGISHTTPIQKDLVAPTDDPVSRSQWELQRQMDPATGKVPMGMRVRELAYAKTLPVWGDEGRSTYSWTNMGPWNVGGRTRAIGIDTRDDNLMIAGAVSGGIWRTTDGGQSWNKTSAPLFLPSVTALVQDTRAGKEDNWYAAGGEHFGNSATESFSASYFGDGLYVSNDNGLSWSYIDSTHNNTPTTREDLDEVWAMAIDPTAPTDSIELYVATTRGIFRSNDGFNTWTEVLDANGFGNVFTDIDITSTGVVYATISSAGAQRGLWRSPDGLNWTRIDVGSGWPAGNFRRASIGIDPNDEDVIYFLSNTPNAGAMSNISNNNTAWNSLWKYEYLAGNGDTSATNSIWTDLSLNLPHTSPTVFDNYYSQFTYDICVGVQPGNPNNILIGGTNLYKSTDGFTSDSNTTQLAGYLPGSSLPNLGRVPNQHPDQHEVLFFNSNPEIMISANDGGVYRTDSISADSVIWTDLNRGYVTSQFYTMAIDHQTTGSDVIMGGMQDNGTWFTKSPNPQDVWASSNGGDGSYCYIPNGLADSTLYVSTQNGNIYKILIDGNGNRIEREQIDPITPGNYHFIHPFTLDPNDHHIMYLPEGQRFWINDSLDLIQVLGGNDSISFGWDQITIPSIGSAEITQLACSETNPMHTVYYGTSNRRIFRMDSANTANPVINEVTNNISSGSYTSSISIDPRDANKVLVCYSNYNVWSIWYTNDGGNYWQNVSGNLEGPPNPPIPAWINSGPSVRWVKIVPLGNRTVFLAATSVGLFSTDTLVADTTAGDSTIWYQQGANSIGNIVCEAIEYRPSDGFTVVVTHGNGAYRSYITNPWGANEVQEMSVRHFNLMNFPNPAKDRTTIRYTVPDDTPIRLTLHDQKGSLVKVLKQGVVGKGRHTQRVNVNSLSDGVYFYSLRIGEAVETRKLIVQH